MATNRNRDRNQGRSKGEPRYGDLERGGPSMSYGDRGAFDRSGGEWGGQVPDRPVGGVGYGGGVGSGMHSEMEMRGGPMPHGGGFGGGFGGGEPTMYGLERRDYRDTYGGNAVNAGIGIGGFGGGIGGGMGGGHFGLGQRGMASGSRQRFGKAPKGYKRSDDRIREEICECIMRHGTVDASDVDVQVRNGEVILSGSVQTRADKRAIEDLIDDVMGVDDIQNNIRVGRGVEDTTGRAYGAGLTGGAMAGSGHGLESSTEDATGPEGATMNKRPVKRLSDGETRSRRGRSPRGKSRS